MERSWKKAYQLCLALSLSATFVSSQKILCDESFMGHVASGVLASQNFPLNYSTALRTCTYKIYSSRAAPCSTYNVKLNQNISSNYQRSQSTQRTQRNVEVKDVTGKSVTRYGPPNYRWYPANAKEQSAEQVEELVCFKFYRFSLRNSPKNCSSRDAYLGFPDGARYCAKGTLSMSNVAGSGPIPEDREYLEIEFRAYSEEEHYTDLGFFATFEITKGFKKLYVHETGMEKVTTPTKAPCPDDHFTCFDLTCIPRQLMCNGGFDCPDRSDETYIHARCHGRQNYEGCDFELTDGVLNEMCGFRAYNWIRGMTSAFGPRYDHTIAKAFGPGNFTYTRFNAQKIDFISDDPSTSPQKSVDRCFRFWYFMSGEGIGGLDLYVNSSSPQTSPNTPAWSRRGEHGSYWNMGELDIPSYITKIEQIKFAGLRGSFIDANIGLDDLSMTDGVCYGNDISCTFELGTCSWRLDTSGTNQYEMWLRRQGNESGFDQGPEKDCSDNGNGYFMYFGSSNETGRIARMISKPVSKFPYTERWCLSFCYLIQKGQGTFRIRIGHVDQSETIVFSDNQEKGWYSKQMNIRACKPIQIIVEAEADIDGSFEVAVDNIVISQAMCYEAGYTTITPAKSTTSDDCIEYFCCKDGKHSISWDKVCDDRFDCDDKSDEADCNKGGLSVIGIVAIVGGIGLVMILITFHLLWTIKRRRAAREDNSAPAPSTDSEEFQSDMGFDSPMGYGDPPPLYTEIHNDTGALPPVSDVPDQRPFLTISLRWEPPPAYDISIVGLPKHTDRPGYTPRTDPPSFEMAIRESGWQSNRDRPVEQTYGVQDSSVAGPSEQPRLSEPSNGPSYSRAGDSVNTRQSIDASEDQCEQPSGADCLRDYNTRDTREPISILTSRQSALAGTPATGHELERYYNPAPMSFRPSENCSHASQVRDGATRPWSIRRSFRRMKSRRQPNHI